mgnify:CR=1 FL=1
MEPTTHLKTSADQSTPLQATSNHILSCEHVGFRVDAPGGELVILDDISFDLKSGETLAIVGASGSGKTTLLGLLAGLDRPTEGDVVLAGQGLSALNENQRADLRQTHVGFVFQSFHLLPTLTALENVMLALEIAKHPQPKQRAQQALDMVGLSKRLAHYPRQLSGGEQQRVAIARAFANGPKILFADEPTGNLDRTTGNAVADLLFDLNAQSGTALVLVTHDPALAERCQTTHTMDGGRLVR